MPRIALGRSKANEIATIATAGETTIAARANDLIQLVYVSSAGPRLTQDDLDAIASSSARHNAAEGITGLLLHQGDVFSGTLEGPERRVLQRMEVIIRDPRHASVRVLREACIATRRFDNWSFGSLPDGGQGGRQGERLILSLARGLH